MSAGVGTAVDPTVLFLVAGEASGDVLGARLMAALKRRTGAGVRFVGVGGDRMGAEGLSSLFPMRELSVMGLTEVLPHVPRLLRRLRQTALAVTQSRPAALITIDSPGFALRLAARLHGWPGPKIHYVAPTVWAWRPGRARVFQRHLDHLLALLPFEPPYFQRVGLPCSFVGHPVLESGADTADAEGFRHRHGLTAATPLFCFLLGSRRGEATRLAPVYAETARVLLARAPTARLVIPTPPDLAAMVRGVVAKWPGAPLLVTDPAARAAAMRASVAAVAASGTVALELALAGTPATIAYRLAPLTYAIVRRLVESRYVHLLNILLDRAVVPERLQGACRPETLADDLIRLAGPDGRHQIAALAPALRQLSPPGGGAPSDCAAAVVWRLLRQQRQGDAGSLPLGNR